MESQDCRLRRALQQRDHHCGMFREIILPGAFRAAIGRDDCRALFNHDANYVLGRTKAGTLTLTEDVQRLAVRRRVARHGLGEGSVHQHQARGCVAVVVFVSRRPRVLGAGGAALAADPGPGIVRRESGDVIRRMRPRACRRVAVASSSAALESRHGRSPRVSTRCDGCGCWPRPRQRVNGVAWDTAVRLMGEREGRRMLYYSLCSPCSERRDLDRQARQLRGGDGSATGERGCASYVSGNNYLNATRGQHQC